MSKTFIYTLLVIGVYVVIISPKLSKTKKNYDNEKETVKEESTSITERKTTIKAGYTV